jgi:hypothetical protein
MSIVTWWIIFVIVMFIFVAILVDKLYKQVGQKIYHLIKMKLILIVFWGILFGSVATAYIINRISILFP